MSISKDRTVSNFIKAMEDMKRQKEAIAKKRAECKHEWKSKYEFVYDYDHQDCHKCGASRMV